MTTTQTTSRREIYFTTDKRGNKRAHYWSTQSLRTFPMPLAEAELLVATGAADVLCCKPFQPRHTCGKPE